MDGFLLLQFLALAEAPSSLIPRDCNPLAFLLKVFQNVNPDHWQRTAEIPPCLQTPIASLELGLHILAAIRRSPSSQ